MKVSPELERQALNPKAKFFPKNLDSSDVPNFRSNATLQVTWLCICIQLFWTLKNDNIHSVRA